MLVPHGKSGAPEPYLPKDKPANWLVVLDFEGVLSRMKSGAWLSLVERVVWDEYQRFFMGIAVPLGK